MRDQFRIDYDSLFGNDSGEDEDPRVLESYFVDLPSFRRFYDPNQPLAIVRARKGVGKSALLSRLAFSRNEVSQRQEIVIRTTGNELMGLGEFSNKPQAYLENHWKQVICKRICVEIGTRINFAISDNSMSLVEAAELEGFKGTNVVTALAERIGGLLPKLLSSVARDEAGGKGAGAILRKGVSNPIESLRKFQEDKERVVWILIDDIDAKYIDDEDHQQRVGAFFSALRSLAFSMTGLKIRASVRTDVWGMSGDTPN